MTRNTLLIDFVDERFEASTTAELTFGRAASVTLDEKNEFMSRVVGSFIFHQGSWWIRNASSTVELNIVGDTGARKTLPPGTSDPLTAASGTVRFKAGRSNYELGFVLADPPQPPDAARTQPKSGIPAKSGTSAKSGVSAKSDKDIPATKDFGIVPLNAEQRAMLTLFAQAWLQDPAATHHDVPTNADVAHRLGWSLRKLDRKLDYLCARLDDAGVRGLRGEKGDEATDRRRRLVEHVIGVGLISEADLSD